MTTVEQKNINIKELEREKEITRQCYESSQEKLINEKYDYDYKNIYYDRKVGKIDREEQHRSEGYITGHYYGKKIQYKV